MAGKLESMWKKLHMVPKTAKQIPSATVVTYPASVPREKDTIGYVPTNPRTRNRTNISPVHLVQYDMEAFDDEVDHRKVATIEACPRHGPVRRDDVSTGGTVG